MKTFRAKLAKADKAIGAVNGAGLPYDTQLEKKTIKVEIARKKGMARSVRRVVTLNSSVVVGLGALALASNAKNVGLQHPHLLVTALTFLLSTIALGTIYHFTAPGVASFTANYWASIQRRRELASIDADYAAHLAQGSFNKHQNLEYHHELRELLPAARAAIVDAYEYISAINSLHRMLAYMVATLNVAAYLVLVIFVAESVR